VKCETLKFTPAGVNMCNERESGDREAIGNVHTVGGAVGAGASSDLAVRG